MPKEDHGFGGLFSWKVEERFWIVLDVIYGMHFVWCLLAACFDPLTYKGRTRLTVFDSSGPEECDSILNIHVIDLVEGICLRNSFHRVHLPFLIWLFASPSPTLKEGPNLPFVCRHLTPDASKKSSFLTTPVGDFFILTQEGLVVNRLPSFQQNQELHTAHMQHHGPTTSRNHSP